MTASHPLTLNSCQELTLSDLVLIVGGPFHGQATHLDLHAGPSYGDQVSDYPETVKLSEWSDPDPFGSRLTSTLYTIRGTSAIQRFYPSWLAFGGERLVGLMLAPSVRERGLSWLT